MVALGFSLGLASACFTPPNDSVLFSCEFDGDDRCPPDYECRADGCCHQIGSSADEDLGACALGGNSGMGSTGTGLETGTETETGPDPDMETGTDSTGESGSDTGG